jgi:hypothetical protein
MDWKNMIQKSYKSKGLTKTFTKWEPLSFKKVEEKDEKTGVTKKFEEVIVKVDDNSTIKTKVEIKEDGTAEATEEIEEKPVTFTGTDEDDKGFVKIDEGTKEKVV